MNDAQTPPPIGGFDHLHVFVADRAAAVRWYERVLGLRPVEALRHWAQGGGPLVVADAAARVHLALFERPPQANRAMLALAIAAADWPRWQAHLRLQGIASTIEDHGESWSIYFDDPDGNPYEITCYEVASLRGASHDAMSH